MYFSIRLQKAKEKWKSKRVQHNIHTFPRNVWMKWNFIEQTNKINHSTATCSHLDGKSNQSLSLGRKFTFSTRENETRGSWKCWQACWSFIGGSGTAVWAMQICTWKRTSDVMPLRRFLPPCFYLSFELGTIGATRRWIMSHSVVIWKFKEQPNEVMV